MVVDMFDTTSSLISNYLWELPLLLIWLVGLIWAVIRWEQHPQMSLLAVVALGLFLLQALFGTFLGYWFEANGPRYGMNFIAVAIAQAILRLVRLLLMAFAWIMLLVALFSRRDKSEPR